MSAGVRQVINVRYTGRGAWTVFEDDRLPLSTHTSETEAEAAARRHAERRGGAVITVYDCYHRARVLPASPRRRRG